MATTNMGIGLLGDRNIIFKRKFRWTFRVEQICGNLVVPDSFVKMAARPNLTVEPTEINYLNAKTWIPGKPSWEQITVTYYDIASDDNIDLWSWLATVYDFTFTVQVNLTFTHEVVNPHILVNGNRFVRTSFVTCPTFSNK